MDILQKNTELIVEISGYNSEGDGVAHIDSRPVFVPRTIMGEVWQVKVLKDTKKIIYARGEKLIKASPNRLPADCKAFGKCGGCSFLHMSYEQELSLKLQKVNDALRRIAGVDFNVSEIIPAEKICGYRNKAIYNVAREKGALTYGFYRKKSHDIAAQSYCQIQSPESNGLVSEVVSFCRRNNIPAYDERTGKGVLRHVFTRQGFQTGELQAVIVAARGFGALTEGLISHLRESVPGLSSLYLCVKKDSGNTVLSGDFHRLWGGEFIRERMCGLEFEIAPQAFFQINPAQAEKLYARAGEYLSLKGDETVLDLYCGTGTIGLSMAGRAGRIIGIDSVPEAIENAGKNALANGIENAEFICCDAAEARQALFEREIEIDALIIDPPRKGLSEEALKQVDELAEERIVYISCDVSTLARDIKRLGEKGWRLEKAAAVDMFPRTWHCECVVLMSKLL
ncbi:23S rRNA (uracil(1939)-C(5))-methyltransferase RlmD [Clostridiaceae bacterium OttesenSCG-928-D20]|nr:23S rRNA (uracil(1939)-C(5))-methyltransferase RlmD [Clostridiaceae bacterium OttesenSCG-928-D20]